MTLVSFSDNFSQISLYQSYIDSIFAYLNKTVCNEKTKRIFK